MFKCFCSRSKHRKGRTVCVLVSVTMLQDIGLVSCWDKCGTLGMHGSLGADHGRSITDYYVIDRFEDAAAISPVCAQIFVLASNVFIVTELNHILCARNLLVLVCGARYLPN